MDVEELSILSPLGYQEGGDCGYCENIGGGSCSYYALGSSLSPATYQKLLDRSWRRSGKLLYRPNQQRSCCPAYTIRLDSSQFRPNKDQRQTINRFNNYVIGDELRRSLSGLHSASDTVTKKNQVGYNLIERIHEPELDRLSCGSRPSHKLEITLESDSFTEEKYSLFRNYQANIHQEPPSKISRDGFRRFLCSSPLRSNVNDNSSNLKKLGSYHQMYRLDGKLVAMGVLDLLHDCVSSVYFMYDESVHTHGFGKLGALREIAMAMELDYKWWYPGYYIHSCPKMTYKAAFRPQYVLDPEQYVWESLDEEMLALFDRKKYVRPHSDRAAARAQQCQEDGTTKSSKKDDSGDDDDESPHTTVFDSQMPGIAPKEAVLEATEGFRFGLMADMSTVHVVEWPAVQRFLDNTTKEHVWELAAVVGIDLMRVICVNITN